MKKQYDKEEIINSLDGIKKAEPSPFLYTRIQSRLNEERSSSFFVIVRLLTRPVLAVTLALIFILVNGYILASRIIQRSPMDHVSQPLAAEYVQHVINPYEINENPE